MDRYCNEVNLANTSIRSGSSSVGMDGNENDFHAVSSSSSGHGDSHGGSGSSSSSSSSIVMGSEGIGVTAEGMRAAVNIQDSQNSGGARSSGGSNIGSRNDRSTSSSSSTTTTTSSSTSSSFTLQAEPTITPTINNTPSSTTTSVSTYHYRRMVSTLQEKFRLEQVG